MQILVTGNLGYIGTVLTEVLEERKETIKGYDVGIFKECLLEKVKPLNKQIIKDIRDVDIKDLIDSEIVIHMSALSNDPLGELNTIHTEEINFHSTIKIAKLAKQAGCRRFIYVSSLSMYGISNIDGELDEYKSEKNPLTAYARTKWEAEQYLSKLVSDKFEIVKLRPSTVYGYSPRLRCDIVFNNLLASGYTTGNITIKSDGSPWRPAIHVKDLCSAIIACIDAPSALVNDKVFNVGVQDGNYKIKELADVVKKVLPNCKIIFTNEHNKDVRTYKISFKRILSDLKDFYKPSWNLEKGAYEMINKFKKVNFSKADFIGSKTNRIMKLKESRILND